ncbi:unnamed protein product [Rangifer tarandus platyrhynchus]|uniref:Uncharacterized protein n=1 Tax=Rangifer tarandus platyrhynchus TaxID=3082113 RepID=A0AC59YSB5_RANTA
MDISIWDGSLSPRSHIMTRRVLVPTLSPCPEFGQGFSDDDHPLLGNGKWGRTYVLLASGEPSTATMSHGLCGGLEFTPNHQHEAPITEGAPSRSSIPVTPEKHDSILSLPAVASSQKNHPFCWAVARLSCAGKMAE